MHVAVEPLALGLEALEDALGHGDDLLLLVVRLELDAGAAEVRGARLDVADRELQLLQPAERALRSLIRLARRARLTLGALRVGLLEPLDLLAQPPDFAPQLIDDEVELTIKVVLARKLRGGAFVRLGILGLGSRLLGHVDQDEGVR
ncbi:MAG TPA: hypothetical protein VIM83_02260 [Candidatus Limnocylindria bacterium]